MRFRDGSGLVLTAEDESTYLGNPTTPARF